MRKKGQKNREKKRKAKDDEIALTILGSFFKSGMGNLSKSTEQYTPLRKTL